MPTGEIVLDRGEKGLGFLIVGGLDSPVSELDSGIFVAKVVCGAAADVEGRLAKGDKLLEVNGASMSGVTHKKAVEILTKSGHKVTLKVDYGSGLNFIRKLSAKRGPNGSSGQNDSTDRGECRDTYSRTSDEVYKTQQKTKTCVPCNYEGKTQTSCCYCVQCRENFCTTCRAHHQKFSFLRKHTLEDVGIVKHGGVMSIVEKYQTLIS